MNRNLFLGCIWAACLTFAGSSAYGQFVDHHPPYQDQHFGLDHTPLYDYGARPQYGDYYADRDSYSAGASSNCVACESGACSHGNGSRGPTCPKIENAILQVYVPDGMQVEVNGHATKLQTLAGIHRDSRIFSLEGLDVNRVSPCDVVVVTCGNNGTLTRHQHLLSVRAGQRYAVRYPRDFQTATANSATANSVAPAMPPASPTILEIPVGTIPSIQ